MLTSIADLQRGQDDLSPFIQLAASLSARYDRFLEGDEGDGHLREAGIHASELGCPRKAYYTLIGEKKKAQVPKKWKQRFEHGKAVHLMVQQQFRAMAENTNGLVQFDAEVKVHGRYQKIAEELQLDSSTDGVFTFFRRPQEPPVLRVLTEIKSESPDGWGDLKAPKPEHIKQVHLYMRALDVPLCWFFYFNKGDQNNTTSYAPWLIAYNPTIWREIETECRTILQMAEMRTEPDRVEGIWCEFCPYRTKDVCNPNYLARRGTKGMKPGQVRS
jgi:hypothetical protein